MRDLDAAELKQVYGGWGTVPPRRRPLKGNNGWGNGGEDGVPGNSTRNSNSQTASKAADGGAVPAKFIGKFTGR